MQKIKFILCFLLPFVGLLKAQELNCKVQVVSQQIQGVDRRVFDNLQSSIIEFMNSRKWTNDQFTSDEKIECSILINLTEILAINEYKATVQVQSRRPVFKTSYNTTMFNHNDQEFQLKYIDGQSLDYSENTNLSNLTSVLAFYAYMIIGFDYDSFSLNGGTAYFQKAANIVNNCSGAAEKGWKSNEGNNNRYWLAYNMSDPVFSPIREINYRYHRKGMDIMAEKKEEAKQVIFGCLQALDNIHKIRPVSFPMQIFFNAKADELVNLYSSSSQDEINQAVEILNRINPGNIQKYQKLQQK